MAKRETVTGVPYSELRHKTEQELDQIWMDIKKVLNKTYDKYPPEEEMYESDEIRADICQAEMVLVTTISDIRNAKQALVRLGQLDEEDLLI